MTAGTTEGGAVSPAAIGRHRLHDGQLRVSRIDGNGVSKLYVGVLPDTDGNFDAQAGDLYRRLDHFLEDIGARPCDVITERVFLSDLPEQAEGFRRIREEHYGGAGPERPCTSYLQQPPCRPGALVELQARVIFARRPDEGLVVRDLSAPLGAGSAKVVSYRGYDHIYAHNITGGEAGDGLAYGAQTESAFERAENLLQGLGLSFRDVVRTWLYLDEMERDYDELNRVRNAFFERAGVERLPASTGIEGGVYPPDRGGCLDLYALRTEHPVQVETMHAASLNEAPAYGSRFSRGLVVTRDDRHIAYVSGTASIDDQGQVVHVGDSEGQIHRMLHNVENLLAGSGATMGDIVRATTYLKDGGDYELYQGIWRAKGLPRDIPHTICRADVCRPDWLCEIEAVAIFPPRAAS